MNVRKVDNELINADVVTPVMSYATFNNELTESTKEYMVTTMNEGHKMLEIYEKFVGSNGTNTNLHSICEMILEMDEVFRKFDRERYSIKKKSHV
jgi:hypothetical protein